MWRSVDKSVVGLLFQTCFSLFRFGRRIFLCFVSLSRFFICNYILWFASVRGVLCCSLCHDVFRFVVASVFLLHWSLSTYAFLYVLVPLVLWTHFCASASRRWLCLSVHMCSCRSGVLLCRHCLHVRYCYCLRLWSSSGFMIALLRFGIVCALESLGFTVASAFFPVGYSSLVLLCSSRPHWRLRTMFQLLWLGVVCALSFLGYTCCCGVWKICLAFGFSGLCACLE